MNLKPKCESWHSKRIFFFSLFYFIIIFFYFFYHFFFLFVVDFVIHWNETAKGLHVFPIPIPPPPPSPPIPSRFSQNIFMTWEWIMISYKEKKKTDRLNSLLYTQEIWVLMSTSRHSRIVIVELFIIKTGNHPKVHQ